MRILNEGELKALEGKGVYVICEKSGRPRFNGVFRVKIDGNIILLLHVGMCEEFELTGHDEALCISNDGKYEMRVFKVEG